MEHKHTYDAEGKQLCCTEEQKIYSKAGAKDLIDDGCCSTEKYQHNGHSHGHEHSHDHSDDDGHDHSHAGNGSTFEMFLPSIISLLLLLIAIAFDNYFIPAWFTGWTRIIWYVVAYIPVGFPVIKEAIESIRKGELFSEFLLM